MRRTSFDETHDQFRDTVRAFVRHEIVPRAEAWEVAGIVDRTLYAKAGELGMMGLSVPEQFGGGGTDDFGFEAVIQEEICRAGVLASGQGIVNHHVALPYFVYLCNDEQQARWLPGLAAGTTLATVAMTEPGTGSDLAAVSTRCRRDGDVFVLNGAKLFISSGINSDLVIVVCQTEDPDPHQFNLLVVERGMPGFERGRNLAKIGQHAADTAELFFDDVQVPVANLLGHEGRGFYHLVNNLPRERLGIANVAVEHAATAFEWTLQYCKDRHAFGQPIASFQNSRFALATMRTELDIARVFVDREIDALNSGELSAEQAAEAKWWCTDLNRRVLDTCLQLHGGYGYMEEYPIARAWRDGRVMSIYGGTNEIMKEIIGRRMLGI